MSSPYENKMQKSTFSLADAAAARELLGNDDFIQAFAACMELLGVCFYEMPSDDAASKALDALKSMDIAHDWPFGSEDALSQAQDLLSADANSAPADVRAEFTRLFRGPAALPAPPFGSVYMDRDQVTYGWSWLALRNWMREHGFERLYEQREPEDQFGRLLVLCAVVARMKPQLLPELLGNHVLCWSTHFLVGFKAAAQGGTYGALAVLAETTLEDVQHLLGITPAKRKFFR